jgi:hypothetical protein
VIAQRRVLFEHLAQLFAEHREPLGVRQTVIGAGEEKPAVGLPPFLPVTLGPHVVQHHVHTIARRHRGYPGHERPERVGDRLRIERVHVHEHDRLPAARRRLPVLHAGAPPPAAVGQAYAGLGLGEHLEAGQGRVVDVNGHHCRLPSIAPSM